MSNRACFLDRDGTTIIDKDYLSDPDEIEFIPGVPQELKRLEDEGYLLIIISNQSGVARGLFTEDVVQLVNRTMCERLEAEYGVHITACYYCPHHPSAGVGKYRKKCDCRKPAPGMVLRACEDWDIDPSASVVVGDKASDAIDLPGLQFVRIKKDQPWSLDI